MSSPGGDSHYMKGEIEPVDFIASQGLDYLAGNVIKYITRYRFKGRPAEDLEKARWYIDRLIDQQGNGRHKLPCRICNRAGRDVPDHGGRRCPDCGGLGCG